MSVTLVSHRRARFVRGSANPRPAQRRAKEWRKDAHIDSPSDQRQQSNGRDVVLNTTQRLILLGHDQRRYVVSGALRENLYRRIEQSLYHKPEGQG